MSTRRSKGARAPLTIDLNHKLIEIVNSYKASPDNLWSIQPDRLD
jgi:hypothetical protein